MDLMVTRSLPDPVSLAALGETRRSGERRLAADGVHWRESHLSRCGLRLWCRFEAPDAGSVHSALHALGEPVDGVWSGSFELRNAAASPSVIVEDRLTAGAARDVLERACGVCGAFERVRCSASFVSPDGARVFWLWDAPDAELVRIALRRAGSRPVGVWPLAGGVRAPSCAS